MRFEKGNKAASGKGRPKGSKALKKLLKAEHVMADLDFNPVEFLVTLAKDAATPTDLKVKIGIELTSLYSPKPKAKEESESIESEETSLEAVSTENLLAFTTKKP